MCRHRGIKSDKVKLKGEEKMYKKKDTEASLI